MGYLIVIIFIFGYIAIAMEHTIKVDKAVSALVTGVLCWYYIVYLDRERQCLEVNL